VGRSSSDCVGGGIAWADWALAAEPAREPRISAGASDRVARSSAGLAGSVGEDEPGGGLGGVGEQFGQDAGVRVRGQHDAGVPEQGLDGREVRAGGRARLAAP
jgi:hypothetical protein